MSFALGSVENAFSRKHLFHHCSRSSWSLLNLIICLFMQTLSNSIRYAQSFLLRSTLMFSLVMRTYRPQCIDSVCNESPRSCTLPFGILSLIVTRMNHCMSFNRVLEESGYHPCRGKPSLFLSRWGCRNAEGTRKPTSWKHQWYVGWAGQLHTAD